MTRLLIMCLIGVTSIWSGAVQAAELFVDVPDLRRSATAEHADSTPLQHTAAHTWMDSAEGRASALPIVEGTVAYRGERQADAGCSFPQLSIRVRGTERVTLETNADCELVATEVSRAAKPSKAVASATGDVATSLFGFIPVNYIWVGSRVFAGVLGGNEFFVDWEDYYEEYDPGENPLYPSGDIRASDAGNVDHWANWFSGWMSFNEYHYSNWSVARTAGYLTSQPGHTLQYDPGYPFALEYYSNEVYTIVYPGGFPDTHCTSNIGFFTNYPINWTCDQDFQPSVFWNPDPTCP